MNSITSARVGLAATLAIAATALLVAPAAMAAPPANDNFAQAEALPTAGWPMTGEGTTADATLETGEVNPQSASGSVWFAWSAPADTRVRIDICASEGDPTLAVLTGSAVNTLTTAASNDDHCKLPGSPKGSSVDLLVDQGTVYKIAVGSACPACEGSFTVRIDGTLDTPSYDFFDFPFRSVSDYLPMSFTGTTNESTLEGGEDAAINPLGATGSVWVDWTPVTTQTVEIEVCDSEGDPTLTAYRGTAFENLEVLASDDDGCTSGNDLGARMSLNVLAGNPYRFAVGTVCYLCEGEFTFLIHPPPEVPRPAQPIVIPKPPAAPPCRKGFKRKNGRCVKQKPKGKGKGKGR